MKKKKSTAKKNGWIIPCVLLGFALGLLTVEVGERFIRRLPFSSVVLNMLLVLLLLYLSLLLHTILHEAGHLVCGLCTGYAFSSFRVFNFMWIRLEGKIRLKKLSIAGTAGQCLLKPPAMKAGKIPVVWYNLGGVFSNLLCSALSLLLFFLTKESALAATCFLLLTLTGVVFAFTNGVPMRLGEVDNDGANVVALRKSEKAVRAFWIQMQINATLAEGVRLKDMPAEWFELPAKEDWENSLVAACAVFRTNYLMDKKAFAEAEALMTELLAAQTAIIGVHRNLIQCELTYLALLSDKEGAEPFWRSLSSFRKSMKRFPTVLRTEYAYALLHDKDVQAAEGWKAKFEKMAKTYPYAADIQSERELIARAEEKGKEANA